MVKKDNKKRRSQAMTLRPVARNCPFCKNKIAPDYKDFASLEKYISDRDKILSKDRTGLCAKHQRRVTTAIKRARHIGIASLSQAA